VALARVADVVVLARSACMSNRPNQAAQRRIFDAVACHQKLHQRVVKQLGQAQLGKVDMHGDPPLAWRHRQRRLEFARVTVGGHALSWSVRLGCRWHERDVRRRRKWTGVHAPGLPTGLALLNERGTPLCLHAA
jgi:hypothetical protein